EISFPWLGEPCQRPPSPSCQPPTSQGPRQVLSYSNFTTFASASGDLHARRAARRQPAGGWSVGYASQRDVTGPLQGLRAGLGALYFDVAKKRLPHATGIVCSQERHFR